MAILGRLGFCRDLVESRRVSSGTSLHIAYTHMKLLKAPGYIELWATSWPAQCTSWLACVSDLYARSSARVFESLTPQLSSGHSGGQPAGSLVFGVHGVLGVFGVFGGPWWSLAVCGVFERISLELMGELSRFLIQVQCFQLASFLLNRKPFVRF